ncbi:MAG: TRAP transporter large permease [Paracoccus sp. (in: a-proteobacteria)]
MIETPFAFAVIAFVVAVLIEIPIAIAIMLAGLLGLAMDIGPAVTARVLASVFYQTTANYTLFVVPMYVLLGALMSNAGIGEQIYRSVQRVVGWMPGGLAATAVGATSFFSGISGSSAADTATFGRISVTEMGRHGYAKPYAAAVVAAAGTFASLIPPSVAIVIYSILAELSIGKMITAAIVPGALSAGALTVFVIVRAILSEPKDGRGSRRREAELGHTLAEGETGVRTSSWSRDLIGVLYAALIFAVVVGGLYGGYFTPSEAGAVAALIALVIALIAKPSALSRRRILTTSLREAAEVTSMIFMLMIGGATLAYFVASTGVTMEIVAWVTELGISPSLIAGIILLLMLPLGMVLDGLSIMLLIVPTVSHLLSQMGLDGIWFGILMLKCIEIGLITPPVGMNVYIVSGLTGVSASAVFRSIWPFIVLDISLTALMFFFPQIILWLPAQMGY